MKLNCDDVKLWLAKLLDFALRRGLLHREDLCWAAGGLSERLGLPDAHLDFQVRCDENDLDHGCPSPLVNPLVEYAVQSGLCGDSQAAREGFANGLTGFLTPRPSDVARRFRSLPPRQATAWFFDLCQASGYVRSDRIAVNEQWRTTTPFGELHMTINVSKPEKDPRDIAAARNATADAWPPCVLCRENEGYGGSPSREARQGLRLVPLELGGQRWYFQFSPYGYYDEHSIVLSEDHRPMKLSGATFANLLEFLDRFPHYFIGSNADLPIVGGSILNHDHYQAGRYRFPMDDAPLVSTWHMPWKGVTGGVLNWPLSVLRLRSADSGALVEAVCAVFEQWKSYSDADCSIVARRDGEDHNTVTPIARLGQEGYELDLALRNNRCTAEHPLGLFHPHESVHHIKKENIGLIEVMGLAVLPARLKKELAAVEEALVSGASALPEQENLACHSSWYKELYRHYGALSVEEAQKTVRHETGQVFLQGLMDCGVFKQDEEGSAGWTRFAASLGADVDE